MLTGFNSQHWRKWNLINKAVERSKYDARVCRLTYIGFNKGVDRGNQYRAVMMGILSGLKWLTSFDVGITKV